ncbi:MAG: SRPBCC domain-containing protein [Jatrophihabitantaceae bacterium]
MSTTTGTTQVYRVYIRASAQAIWDAITQPEWTVRYGYTGHVHYDLKPGGAYTVNPTEQFRAAAAAGGNQLPDVIIEGEVLESDPPRRLVTTFRMLMDPEIAKEPITRITYEIKDFGNGTCSLTLTHELEDAPKLAFILGGAGEDVGAGGGHAWVLSDLKSLLETGSTMAG